MWKAKQQEVVFTGGQGTGRNEGRQITSMVMTPLGESGF